MASRPQSSEITVLLSSACQSADAAHARQTLDALLGPETAAQIVIHPGLPDSEALDPRNADAALSDGGALLDAASVLVAMSTDADSRIAAYQWIKYLALREFAGRVELLVVGDHAEARAHAAARVIDAAARFLQRDVRVLGALPRETDGAVATPATPIFATRSEPSAERACRARQRSRLAPQHRFRRRARSVWSALAAVFF